MANDESYDVVIVGGGAAGLSAALVLGRARRRVAVVDAGSPRNAPAAHMQGFLSRDGMPPGDLLATGRAEVAGYGVELIDGTVVEHRRRVSTCACSVGNDADARGASWSTTGVGDELPDIPGVRERWGRDLLHCPYCHGWEVRDQPLGVLGTNPGSVLHAQLVRQWSDGRRLLRPHPGRRPQRSGRARRPRHRGRARARSPASSSRTTASPASSWSTAGSSRAPRCSSGRSTAPHPDGLLAGLGCDLDPAGFAVVDGTGRTTTPGVWAAGNVVDPRAQVITAAGAGSAAAIAINADLVQEDVSLAVRRHR